MLQAWYDKGKTIFRNILWDADGSGSDVFTFAYYDGISYDATPTPSSCENGVPRNDGYIDIGINIGTPVYSYVLSVDTVAGKVKEKPLPEEHSSVTRIESRICPRRLCAVRITRWRQRDLCHWQRTLHPHTHMTPGPICLATSHGRWTIQNQTTVWDWSQTSRTRSLIWLRRAGRQGAYHNRWIYKPNQICHHQAGRCSVLQSAICRSHTSWTDRPCIMNMSGHFVHGGSASSTERARHISQILP